MSAVLAMVALTSPIWLMLPMWLICAHTATGQRILNGVDRSLFGGES